MVQPVEDDVARAAQLGGVVADARGLARRADEAAVGLGVLVVLVGADRHHLDAGNEIVRPRIEILEEREGAVELAADQQGVGDHDALVGRAAEHGVAHIFRAAAVLEVAADGIAAARRADQRHLAPARRLHDLRHEGGELLHLVLGRGAEGLGLGIVAPRVGIGEIDGEELVTLVAVGLETPDVVDPERARIAVAVHEHDRRQGRFDDRLTAWRPGAELARAPDAAAAGRAPAPATALPRRRAEHVVRAFGPSPCLPQTFDLHVGKTRRPTLRLPYVHLLRRYTSWPSRARSGSRRRDRRALGEPRRAQPRQDRRARPSRRRRASSSVISAASSSASTCHSPRAAPISRTGSGR